MEKAFIHYFSGTGNSLMAAKALCSELEKFGYETTLHAIEKGACKKDNTYSLHIFFFPIYATSVPHIMRKYIKNLPQGKNVKTAIISTNGKISTKYRDGYEGWALHQARLYLKSKNYQVFYTNTLDYPHNVTNVMPPGKEGNNSKIINEANEKVAPIAEKIAKGETFYRGFFLPNLIWSVPFGVMYSLVGRRFFGKIFTTDSSCNSCKLCAKQCPVKAIDASHKQIRWNWKCEGCLRCINNCPKHAIQTSTLRIVTIFACFFLKDHFINSKLIPSSAMPKFGKIGLRVFREIIDILLFLGTFSLMDWLLYYLSYIPGVKKIIGFGHTKFFGRYQAKQFAKDKNKNS